MLHGLIHPAVVTLLSLFPVSNPLGNLPAFVAMTEGHDTGWRHRQALRTALWVFALLAVFALAGRPLLHGLGITLPALQVAGGLVVAHAAFGMVTAKERMTSNERDSAAAQADVSFTPMAMPLIAGPGAIGVVIALTARSHGAAAIGGVILGVLVIAVLAWLTLRFGDPLLERLGPNGVGAMTRIFGFLILAVGVELIAHGVLALAPSLAH